MGVPSFPDEVRQAVIEDHAAGYSFTEIATRRGVSKTYAHRLVQRYYNKTPVPRTAPSVEDLSNSPPPARQVLRVPAPPQFTPPSAPFDPVTKARQQAVAEAQRREYVDALKEHSFRGYLTDLVRQSVNPWSPPPTPPPMRAKNNAHIRHPLLILTDWHFEERVSGAGTLGLNSYDIPTACRRVWRVIQACRDWKRDAEAGGRLVCPDLTVVLQGDFLTGTLHGLERHSDAPNVVRAALACGDLVALALRDLAADFRAIKVIGVVGNHGRLPDDRKVPTKDPTRSWDYVAYQVARRRLESVQHVTWELPDAYGVLYEVGNHLCYSAHGNFIPNNLGVVGYGIRRFTSAMASNLQAAGKPLKYAFFGHWHSANAAEFAGVEAFICPSLIGTQEYSFLGSGAVSKSAQLLFLFDRELGLVTQERFYGEGLGYAGTYEVEL